MGFSGAFGMTVLRDAAFAFVGKIPTNLQNRFVPCNSPDHIVAAARQSGVVGIITHDNLASLVPQSLGLATSTNPTQSAYLLHEEIAALADFQWQSFESVIDPSAIVHPSAYIAERDVVIGSRSVIHPNAVILPRSIIGADCAIGPGTVVATDAFEVNTHSSPYRIMRQSGGVRLADFVEVQAKCTLVRATFGGFTELGRETKLDCQVHFAHDCVAGNRVRIAACAEISGRVTIGDDCFVGPNSSISNGVNIGNRAKITLGAVVTKDVADDETVTGNFAVPHKKWLDFMRTFK